MIAARSIAPAEPGGTPAASADAAADSAPGIDQPADAHAELRRLIVGPERDRLDALEQRLAQERLADADPHTRAERQSETLIEAIGRARQRGDDLSTALQPDVEHGVMRSIREDPEIMAEALYPVLGPAVRKLVASLFEAPKNSLADRMSLGARPYSIEQIFLIHRQTSLVLAHEVRDDEAGRDADIVSGMLEAIRGFVQEAFGTSDFDGMRTLNVGDITVWVEWGPQAVCALVIRGMAPESLREDCADALRELHRTHAGALSEFDGDPAHFADAAAQISAQLNSGTTKAGAPQRSGGRLKTGLLAGAMLLCGSLWLADSVGDARSIGIIERSLDAIPGMAVVGSQEVSGTHRITVLRDPDAASPDEWLATRDLAALGASIRWIPYLSMDPAMRAARARSTP